MSVVNRALTYFVDFEYENEMIKEVYRRDLDGLKIIFDHEDATSGAVYKIRKEDYRQMNFITFTLDDNFYNFYLQNIRNKHLLDIDLRVYYYLNSITDDVKYKVKIAGRPTKILFSKTNMCSAFIYPDRGRNIKVACIDDAFTQKNGKYYCLNHVPN